MEDSKNLTGLESFLNNFGEVNGLLILGIIGLFLWVQRLSSRIHKQHISQLQDKQAEIDRLAEDNRAYRERYLVALDRKINREESKS